jgi:DHA1 family bicyclomycin/chloramphenicol resistance-like MFS transporter
MIGFLQMGVGALASLFVGILEAQKLSNLAGIFVTTSGLALIIFLIGSRRIIKSV